MKRPPAKKRERARTAAPSAPLPEMEQPRDLREVQNEELGKAHAAFDISHQRLAELHEQAPVGYLTFDSEGCIRAINTEALRLLGVGRPQVIGKPFLVYVEKADRKKFFVHLFRMRRATTSVATDLRLVTKEGTVRQVRMTTDRHRETEGHPTLFLSAIEDVTELRAASANAAYLAALVESSQDGIMSFTPDGIILSWNAAAEKSLGYSAAEMIGRHRSILAPEDRLGESEQVLKMAASGERVPPFETVRRRKDGTLVDVEISLSPIVENGRVVAVTLVGRDISARKRMEQALRESQRLTRATLDAIPAQIALIDESGTILDINRAWQKFSGENEGSTKALGRGVNYLAVCDNVHGLESKDARRFAAGLRAVLSGRKRGFTMDYACHAPTEQRWFAGYVTPVAGPGARMAVIAHVNITAVKLAEEKFRGVMECAPDALVITDREGKIEMVNRQTERLFGYTRKELVGQTVEMLMPQAYRHAHAARHGEYADEPTYRPMSGGASFPARRKDASEFPAEIGLSPLQTAGGLLVCSVIRDITERKKAEDAIRTLNAELEERVAARTAALLNSANVLAGSVEALQKEKAERRRLDQEVIEISETERERIGQDLHDDLGQQLAGLWFLSATLEKSLWAQGSPEADNAGRIAGQLDKALALTRNLAHGLQPVMPEPGGLMAALSALAGRSSELFKMKCRLKCHRPVEIHDPGAATHLYRIAQEAVTNAARHAHAKHVTILLSSSQKELVLSVTDDGTGMEEAVGKHEGMGIRTMKYRAEAMGGTLIFHNNPGGGTSVICTAPAPKKH